MPTEAEILEGHGQHQTRCPSCLSNNTRLVPGSQSGESFMGCDGCGHTWVGQDFPANEQREERLPIPVTDLPPDTK